jgi:hypothetical protein
VGRRRSRRRYARRTEMLGSLFLGLGG